MDFRNIKSSAKKNYIDPNLIGEWRDNRFRQFFSSEGYSFYGDVAFPISIQNNGNKLIYGSEYYRMPGTQNTGTIVGDWRSDEQGEVKHFHHDGTYLGHYDNQALMFYGTYQIIGNFITNLECRTGFETVGNNIILDPFDVAQPPITLSYQIENNILRLTDKDGITTVLYKWP